MRTGLVVVGTVAALVGGTGTARSQSDAQRCARALLQAAGKHASCVFRVRAVQAMTGTPHEYRVCEDRFGKKVFAIRQKYRQACPKNLWTGGSQRFVDQGNGTVRDEATGLEWEKKDHLDGKPNLGDPHDADNLYTWTAGPNGKAADGTAFTGFLAALNAGSCFAGHCDWRLPSLNELQTILRAPKPCDANPCIDPVFGPTTSSTYWSGETSAYHPARAWYLFFISGYWTTAPKVSPYHVRAVRGGVAVQ